MFFKNTLWLKQSQEKASWNPWGKSHKLTRENFWLDQDWVMLWVLYQEEAQLNKWKTAPKWGTLWLPERPQLPVWHPQARQGKVSQGPSTAWILCLKVVPFITGTTLFSRTPVFSGSPGCPEPFRWILDFFPVPHLRWVMVFVTRKMFRVLLSPMSSQSCKDWEHRIRYRQPMSEDLDPGYQEQVTQVVLEMRSNPFISRWFQTKKKKKKNGKFSGIIWPFITSNQHLDSWNAGYIYLRI